MICEKLRLAGTPRWGRLYGGLLMLGFLLLGGARASGQDHPRDLEIQDEWEAIMRWTPPAENQAPAADEARGARARGTSSRRDVRAPRKSGGKTARTRSSRGVSTSYEALRQSWHAPAPESELAASGETVLPALVFYPVGESEPVVLVAQTDQGGFGPEQLELARKAFRSYEGGPAVSERLLDLVYRAARHFQAPHVHLISGVRRDRGASRHTHGLAADIVLPGVQDEELAQYFRAQGFVGVGVYPRAGFVHVDVREKSFFWIDPSPPGKRMKIRPILAAEAKAADEASIARGGAPLLNPPRLAHALAKRDAQRRKQGAKSKPLRKHEKLAVRGERSGEASRVSTP